MHAALIFDLGGEDVAVCGRTILAVKSLERQGESIVPLDLGIEVDLARKDLRERHGQSALSPAVPIAANNDDDCSSMTPATVACSSVFGMGRMSAPRAVASAVRGVTRSTRSPSISYSNMRRAPAVERSSSNG
jgi:hypothetical protein